MLSSNIPSNSQQPARCHVSRSGPEALYAEPKLYGGGDRSHRPRDPSGSH